MLMVLFPNEQNFDLLIPLSEKRYQFPARNTKLLKNGKLRRVILPPFYNISQRNITNFVMLFQTVVKCLSGLV